MSETSVCELIGCSGLNSKCPNNPDCSILKKIEQPRFDHAKVLKYAEGMGLPTEFPEPPNNN